ncbi:MAG: hypothetical protein R3324_11465, partial [Halobacteriales archaeon]|nr:hypothetical protein [Halobacteriales archaeon]
SSNIERIRGRRYELVVCAGAPGEKWRANRYPERDAASIGRLRECLADVEVGHLILISTVDVYPDPVVVDESSTIDPSELHPYGLHRRRLERFCRDTFSATVVRLPGLFGPGLKKNVIYDLLTGQYLDRISPDSVYQFYDLGRLWSDVEVVLRHGWSVVNLATEPVSVATLARVAFDREVENPDPPDPSRYDVRTRYADRLGGSGYYVRSRAEVLRDLEDFVVSWQRSGPS